MTKWLNETADKKVIQLVERRVRYKFPMPDIKQKGLIQILQIIKKELENIFIIIQIHLKFQVTGHIPRKI